MKYILSLSLCIILTVSAIAQPKLFKLKSGHIEYKLTGNTEGVKSFYWDDYGVKQYIEEKSKTTITMFGVTDVQEHHSFTIHYDGYVYSYDFLTKEAGKTSVEAPMDLGEFVQNAYTEEQQLNMRDNTLAGLGGEMAGSEMFLGRKCEIMKIAGSKSWIYKEVSLKSETKVMGQENIETAISFEENPSIPASKFIPPSDINFKDYSEQSPWGGMTMEEDDASESDQIPVNITKDQFCKAVNSISAENFSITACMEFDGIYTATGLLNGTMVGISPIHQTNVEMAKEMGELPKDSEFFTISGHNAIFSSKIYDEEEGKYIDMPMLMIHFKKHQLYMTIAATGTVSKQDLVSIAKKIKF